MAHLADSSGEEGIPSRYPSESAFKDVDDLEAEIPNGKVVKIHRKELELKGAPENWKKANISDVECLGTYNWIREDKNVILVPGAPPVWMPSSHPVCVGSKTRKSYFANDLEKWLRHPLEPAIHAAVHMYPGFDIMNFHIATDPKAIDCMVAFVASEPVQFTLDVEVVNETVFIVCKGEEPYEGKNPYKSDILTHCVSWEGCVKDSVSHHRVISYVFGGLRILIRSTCHGYLPEAAGKVEGAEVLGDIQDIELPNWLASLQGDDVPVGRRLIPYREGKIVPQEALFDLKGVVPGHEALSEADLRRLWVRQVPKAIIATHDCSFKSSQISDVTEVVQKWEEKHQPELEQLSELLWKIGRVANQSRSKKLSIRRFGDVLQIIELGVPPVILSGMSNSKPTPVTKGLGEENDGKGRFEQTNIPRSASWESIPNRLGGTGR
ncbi:hypothetical protein FQN49_005221 [Arthroderma sp. PD_2]|nr:hypothetical protein FQN49_005221 [Arthroderma sp. PD_2]